MAVCRRRKPLLYDSTPNNTKRPASICAPSPIRTTAPAPRTALDGTAAPVRNPFPFVRPGRMVGKKSACYETRKHLARHGSTIYLPTPESTWTARPGRESCIRPLCKIELQSTTACLILFFLPHSRTLSQPRPQPCPHASKNTMREQNPCKGLRREGTPRGS